jgi:hypothetical protein
MPQGRKSLVPLSALAVVFAVALAVGYALPRSRTGGDLLDAVAAVQRDSPRFLISEPCPPANWARMGALYLCRAPRTAEQIDELSKYPWDDRGWEGIVCFKGALDPRRSYDPWISEGGSHCVRYHSFAVFGDPGCLEEVCGILAAAGFEKVSGPLD